MICLPTLRAVACAPLLAGLMLAAAAPALAEEEAEACLRVPDIRSTDVIDETRILARGQGRKPYLITLRDACPQLNFDPPLRFGLRSAEVLRCLEPGDVIQIPIDLVCFIDSIELITEEELTALREEVKAE
ncbi:MAG: hypothetical protein HXY25_08360 [Alphaproteobacteria bacterium]|nr:hypothetical protein [Alphaproteobacteria bacterium]